ncbi:glycosyltransferase family 4 protein [Flavihumibacter sp. CACIAM 22H1]|uniref:glycosyltransferase family 4 protein n=1 Tax=Flavihumibacter sp. CACIAM 22H1 TaxID=1812911 RepID=UPI000AE4157D|nr:glycosyltransferase family 4 protein [Flavihumibacter sp. CACIAM 22H1]
MNKIVVIAQTPPPFHGQAVMQQYLVNADWSDWCVKEHIRLDYSDAVAEIGRFKLSKITKLFRLLAKIRRSTKSTPIDILYYPPAGPHRIPLYRDIITLLYARPRVEKLVLHFHAGGLNQLIEKLSAPEKWLAQKAFSRADHAIVLSSWLKTETNWFQPKNCWVVPNGIEDVAGPIDPWKQYNRKPHSILFVGNLKPEKGVLLLLKAATILKNLLSDFRIRIMGESHSTEMETHIRQYILDNQLTEHVELLGGKTGDNKWAEFRSASIFCLPTYALEAMPVSILEAMMYSLPVVSTNWRAIPDLITEGVEGLLHEVQDEKELADKLKLLLDQPALQEKWERPADENLKNNILSPST